MSYNWTNGSFRLLGHDNPLGYPGPVVPIGVLDGQLVAVYATNEFWRTDRYSGGEKIVALGKDADYVTHSDSTNEPLGGFNARMHRLFAFAETSVVIYDIEREKSFFVQLLDSPNRRQMNPFLRLSLAKASGDISLVAKELFACGENLHRTAPQVVQQWYAQQVSSLDQYGFTKIFLPSRWELVKSYRLPETRSGENVRLVKKLIYDKLSFFKMPRRRRYAVHISEADIRLFREIYVFAKDTLRYVEDDDAIRAMKRRYLSSLHTMSWTEHARHSEIPKLMRLHTKLFNEIARRKIELPFNARRWQTVEGFALESSRQRQYRDVAGSSRYYKKTRGIRPKTDRKTTKTGRSVGEENES